MITTNYSCRNCARPPPASSLLTAIGSADKTSMRSRRHWRPRLLGWPTGWILACTVGALAAHLIAA
jgi:hypothetical protein